MSEGVGCRQRSWRVQRLLLLICLLVEASSFSCYYPCQVCESVPSSNCRYGLVNDTCYCCAVCGRGPGQACSDEIGFCGHGLECYKNYPKGFSLTAQEKMQFPGECRFIASPPNLTTTSTLPTVQPSTSQPIATQRSTQAAPQATATSTVAPLPTQSSTPASSTTGTIPSSSCRYSVCSIDYCTGSTRQRMCSAQGVEGRGECQYTSCRACYLYVKPPCTNVCGRVPTKPCLKRYYKCVDNNLLYPGTSSSALVLRLTDPTIHNYTGRILCHVPAVSSSST